MTENFQNDRYERRSPLRETPAGEDYRMTGTNAKGILRCAQNDISIIE